MQQLRTLSDSELSQTLSRMRCDERSLQVKLLSYLAELEQRQLHLLEGYSSLFSYCTKKLGYSESATNRRVRGARVLRRFPQCAKLLEEGTIKLSTLSLVSGLLDAGNVEELLKEISVGKNSSTRWAAWLKAIPAIGSASASLDGIKMRRGLTLSGGSLPGTIKEPTGLAADASKDGDVSNLDLCSLIQSSNSGKKVTVADIK